MKWDQILMIMVTTTVKKYFCCHVVKALDSL